MSDAVPNGWSKKQLSQICNVVGGGTPERVKSEYWGGEIPWASPTEITSLQTRYISSTKETITEIGLDKSSAKINPAGTLLMTSRASIGYVAINTVPMTTNQGFQSLQCGSDVNNEFMYQYITWLRPELERLSAGSTFSEISSANVKKIKLTLPPLQEQQKIATILSSVDDVIEKTHAQIDKLSDLKTGMMQELFTKGIGHTEFKDSPVGRIPVGWEVCSLGEITEQSAFGPRFSSDFYSDDGNIGCVRTTDMDKSWDINYSTVPLAKLDYAEFESHILEAGDLLVTRSGTCGLVDVFCEQSISMVAAAFLIRFRLKKSANPWFVRYAMMSPNIQESVQMLASGGVQKNLSGSNLKTLLLPMPSPSEQMKIVEAIESLNSKISVTVQKKEQLVLVKIALMQDLLTGKVRVTVN